MRDLPNSAAASPPTGLGRLAMQISMAAIACVMFVATPARAQAYHFAFDIMPANGPSWGTGTHSNTVKVTNDGGSTIPAGTVLSLENRMGTTLNSLTFVTGSGSFNGSKVTQNGPCTSYAMSPYAGPTGHYASLNCKGTLNSDFLPGESITATYTFTITTPTPQMLFTSNNLLNCGTGWIVTPGWSFTGGGLVSCGSPATAPMGTLGVRKIVVNNTGGPAPIPPTFNTITQCSANAASPVTNTPVVVPGGQTVTQSGSLVAGTVCSVTETPLPQAIAALDACKGRGATWTVGYSAPVTIIAGQAAVLTVTNTLDCDKPSGGTLQIHKSIVNTLGVPTPSSFNMTASCSGMAPVLVSVPASGTVTVPPGGQIPDGTVCTITETIPPQVTGVKACPSGTATWVPSNPGPLTIYTAQTTGTIITNILTCDRPTQGGNLAVYKQVVNVTGGPAPMPTTFPVMVHCTLAGANTLNVTLPVPPGSGLSTLPVVAMGSTCSISEGAIPPIANLKACKGANATWTSSYSSPVTMGAGGATMTATNTLACDTSQELVRFEIRKSTGAASIPGTYMFNVACTGPGGPYTGPNPLTITLPGSGSATASVPLGNTCTVTEAPLPAPWVAPAFTGSGGLAVAATGGWTASVGPVTAMGGVLLVANRQVQENATFTIRKNTGATLISGTYVFNLTCTVGGAPVPVTSPVSIMLPGTGATTVGVPSGATCVVTEQSPGANWNPSPGFAGSGGLAVIPGGGFTATVGPIMGSSGTLTVMNERKPESAVCPDRTQSTIGCRVTVTMKRVKGPAIYSVIPSQPATYPMSNTPPSTGAACIIPANAMINQTTCWFNYSASSTTVTLTTASSIGSPPLANWTGDCSALNSATCTLPAVTQATPRSVVVTFP